MKLIKLATMVLCALAIVPVLAADSPVAGTWQTEADTPAGKVAATFTFTQAEGGMKLTIEETGIESKISEVKVDGPNFSFKREISFGGGGLTLAYTGSVSGNTLTAVGKSDGVEVKLTGTRSKAN
jgi:hypothetical protein